MNTNHAIIPARSAPTRTALVAASLILHSPFSILNSSASVPLRWTVETSRVQPAVFDVVRGETIELEAAFTSYGKPVATTNQTAFLAWQTNGMDSAWWITNAVTSGTSATARFTPAMDPGAPTVTGFIGLSDATSSSPISHISSPISHISSPISHISSLIPHLSSLSYRAAFTLRFRKGPGATPNTIEHPVPILDLARTVVINPPWPTQQDFAATTTVMKAELKGYVDGQIEGAGLVTPQSVTNAAGTVASNVVTKAYVEGLGINAGLTTNDVSGVITNHVTSGYLAPASALSSLVSLQSLSSATQATLSAAKEDAESKYIKKSGIIEKIFFGDEERHIEADGSANIGFASSYGQFIFKVHDYSVYSELRADGTMILTEGLAKSSFPIVTNAYTRAASDARYAPTSTAVTVASHASQLSQLSQSVTAKADAATVAQLNVQVQALGANANAEDARVIVTNYNSATRMPEAQFDVKVSNSWITVWHEMTRWNGFLGGFAAYTNGVASALANKGEKEWGWFDSATGSPSPEGILQLAQPRIQVCSGAAYQRYVSTTGSVWVLESNGLVADINGTTNGYFRITDEEGNTHFEIVKGDKQSLFATAKTMTQQQMGVTHYFTTYAVTNAVSAPVAEFSRSLSPATWIKESEAGNPCNVSWTNNGDNSWTVEWWPIGNEPVLFMKAGYERGGETYIRNAVPVSMQYIYLGNTKYLLGTAAIDGHTVLTLTAQ